VRREYGWVGNRLRINASANGSLRHLTCAAGRPRRMLARATDSLCRRVQFTHLSQEITMSSLSSAFSGQRRAARLPIFLLCAGIHALLLGGAAHAIGAERLTVYYGDLNLSDVAGSKALHSRIAHAADLVCGSSVGIRELDRLSSRQRCISAAIENAVHQVNRPATPARCTSESNTQERCTHE
jgi:UrcA family protein